MINTHHRISTRRRKITATCALVCAGALVVARPLAAQTSELHLGDIARVSATAPQLYKFVGRVVALTDDTLALEPDNAGRRIAIPRAALTSAERRLPNASRAQHALAGAGIGFLGGATLGAAWGALVAQSCADAENPCGPVAGAVIGGIGIGTLGLVLGTVIGVGMPVERWRPVMSARVTVIPSQAANRPALVVELRF
jgi:hypothetical protein